MRKTNLIRKAVMEVEEMADAQFEYFIDLIISIIEKSASKEEAIEAIKLKLSKK